MKANHVFSHLLVLAVALGLVFGLASWSSSSGDDDEFTLFIQADTGQFDMIETSPMNGPFFVPGDIVDPTTMAVIGKFRCWGWFFDGGASAVVSQEYELFGCGKIQTQGVEDEGPRAVTGGTGDFSEVSGEITSAFLGGFPNFTVTFELEDSDCDHFDDDGE